MVTATEESSLMEYWRRRNDLVSHYILLLGLSGNSFMSNWFIEQEIKLLQIRWHFLTSFEKHNFLKTNKLCFKKAAVDQVGDVLEQSDKSREYYEVEYSQISELVKTREVVLKCGVSVITLEQLIFPISYILAKEIAHRIKEAKKAIENGVELDERVNRIVLSIVNLARPRHPYLDPKPKQKYFSISDIDRLSGESFPLCMEKLHMNLKKNHHLRNGGRYQYSLFLKGIGLSLHESLNFWGYHFTKRITHDQFVKKYSYHVRHCYGMVGKQADYPPLDCNKILSRGGGGALDYHGCPFKIEDEEGITLLLTNKNIQPKDIGVICALMKGGMPEVACSKLFDLTHNSVLNDKFSHPNIYYFESRKILNKPTTPDKKTCKSCCAKKYELEW